MRIACPSCAAEYEVPDALLASGPRLLRCARCAHQFEAAAPVLPAPAESETESPAPPATAPEAASAPPPIRPRAAPPESPPAPEPELPPEPAPPALAASEPLVDRPPPTRGPSRHSPIDAPEPWRPAEPRQSTTRFAATVAMAWLVSMVVIGAVAWATYSFHAELTAAWPPIGRLYRALGVE